MLNVSGTQIRRMFCEMLTGHKHILRNVRGKQIYLRNVNGTQIKKRIIANFSETTENIRDIRQCGLVSSCRQFRFIIYVTLYIYPLYNVIEIMNNINEDLLLVSVANVQHILRLLTQAMLDFYLLTQRDKHVLFQMIQVQTFSGLNEFSEIMKSRNIRGNILQIQSPVRVHNF